MADLTNKSVLVFTAPRVKAPVGELVDPYNTYNFENDKNPDNESDWGMP